MEIRELKKIIERIQNVFGDDVSIGFYDSEISIFMLDMSFGIDTDHVSTYEEYLDYEREEIIPEIYQKIEEIQKQQEQIQQKIKKYMNLDFSSQTIDF